MSIPIRTSIKAVTSSKFRNVVNNNSIIENEETDFKKKGLEELYFFSEYLEKEHLDKSIDYFSKALEKNESDHEIYFYFAYIFYLIGNLKKSVDYMKIVKVLNPQYPGLKILSNDIKNFSLKP